MPKGSETTTLGVRASRGQLRILAGVAQDFETLLAGRVLQGLGSGGLRVLAYAILRDRVAGDEMARSSSLISIGFLILIFIAPMAGQLVIMLSDWRGLFAWLLIQSGLTALWLARALPADDPLPIPREATAMQEQLRTLAPGFFGPAAQR